jgi:hypothetical protein
VVSQSDILALAVIARPGDTVLIGFEHQLTDEDIEAMDRSFRPIVEQGIKIGYLDQVTSMVVVRPGGEGS